MQRVFRQLAPRLTAASLVMAVALPAQAAAPASADSKQGEAKALEATAYFKQGLFREAADTFMEAYALSHAPDMMYNAARSYEQAGMYERALALFQTYSALPGVSASGRRDAEAHIQSCKQALAARAAAPGPGGTVASQPAQPAAKPAPPAQPTLPAQSTLPAQPAPATATAATPAAASQHGGDTTTWVALGAGAVLAGAAAGLYGYAYQLATTANAATVGDSAAITKYNSDFDQAQTLRWASAGTAVAAGALVGWGAWRWWHGGSQRTTWVAPLGTTPGLVVGGGF